MDNLGLSKHVSMGQGLHTSTFLAIVDYFIWSGMGKKGHANAKSYCRMATRDYPRTALPGLAFTASHDHKMLRIG